MKKLIILLVLFLGVLGLAGCGAKYENGAYTAVLGQEGADYVFVTVFVEKGKVKGYDIDTVQFKNGQYNEQSKKELGPKYGMVNASDIGKEWFEQAAAIEEFFLKEGPEKLSLKEDGYIDNVTGATVKGTSYQEAAIKALELAKEGNQPELPQVVKDILVRRAIK